MTELLLIGGLPIPQATVDRFLAKVDTSGGPDACWPWIGRTKPDGYAQFKLPGNRVRGAHRISYMLFVGGIPDDFVVDHACHDPVVCREGDACPHRRCVNPRHLEAVTQDRNMARGAAIVKRAVPLPPTKPKPERQPAPVANRTRETRRIGVGGAGFVDLSLDLRWLDLADEEAQRLRDAVFAFEAVCREISAARPPLRAVPVTASPLPSRPPAWFVVTAQGVVLAGPFVRRETAEVAWDDAVERIRRGMPGRPEDAVALRVAAVKVAYGVTAGAWNEFEEMAAPDA